MGAPRPPGANRRRPQAAGCGRRPWGGTLADSGGGFTGEAGRLWTLRGMVQGSSEACSSCNWPLAETKWPGQSPGHDGCSVRRRLFHQLAAGDLLQVVENLQRLADVIGALLRVERAVGGEHDPVVRIEGEAAFGRRLAAEHRGVAVEALLEVVERAFLQ